VSPSAVIAPLAPSAKNKITTIKIICFPFLESNIFSGSPKRNHSYSNALLANNKNVFTRCNAITIARVMEEFSPTSSNITSPAPIKASTIINIKTNKAAVLILDFFLCVL